MGMMTDNISLSITCAHCGDGRVSLSDHVTDDAPVHCPSCRTELGQWAEVKEQARAAVFDALRDDFIAMVSCAAPHHAAAA